ncbi:MAG: glutathione S-transferase family protein [Acidobacteriota bacterium]
MTLELIGAPGSPYTRKMRSLLRYRRIPYLFKVRGSKHATDVPDIPVELIPILVYPGAAGAAPRAVIDSTPMLRELEKLYEDRHVVPGDPALALVDALLEDYGDEWLTKAMFHYRWSYRADIDKAAQVLPLWRDVTFHGEELEKLSNTIGERQIERLWVVGSNDDTRAVIEDSYRRFLGLFDEHLATQPFLLGERPGSGDFGVFGQLTQLAQFDPTPMAVAEIDAPRVIAWCEVVEDLSGIEPGEWAPATELSPTLRAILEEIGRVYVPFLLGNNAALEAQSEEVRCEIDGREWKQRTFPYQAKCLRWLRSAHANLDEQDRERFDGLIAGTGCEALFG